MKYYLDMDEDLWIFNNDYTEYKILYLGEGDDITTKTLIPYDYNFDKDYIEFELRELTEEDAFLLLL